MEATTVVVEVKWTSCQNGGQQGAGGGNNPQGDQPEQQRA